MKFRSLSVILLMITASSCNFWSKKPIDQRTVTLTAAAENLRANNAHQKDSLNKALKLLDSAIKIDDRYEPSYANKVFILCAFHNYNDASQVLDKAVELKKYNPKLFILQGMLLEITGHPQDAMPKYQHASDLYDKMIKENPNVVNLKLNKAFLQLLLNNKDEALKEYDEVAKNSKDPNVINMKPFFYIFNRDVYIKSIFQNIN